MGIGTKTSPISWHGLSSKQTTGCLGSYGCSYRVNTFSMFQIYSLVMLPMHHRCLSHGFISPTTKSIPAYPESPRTRRLLRLHPDFFGAGSAVGHLGALIADAASPWNSINLSVDRERQKATSHDEAALRDRPSWYRVTMSSGPALKRRICAHLSEPQPVRGFMT